MPVAKAYKKFNLPYVFDVEDSSENVLIIPEIFPTYHTINTFILVAILQSPFVTQQAVS